MNCTKSSLVSLSWQEMQVDYFVEVISRIHKAQQIFIFIIGSKGWPWLHISKINFSADAVQTCTKSREKIRRRKSKLQFIKKPLWEASYKSVKAEQGEKSKLVTRFQIIRIHLFQKFSEFNLICSSCCFQYLFPMCFGSKPSVKTVVQREETRYLYSFSQNWE